VRWCLVASPSRFDFFVDHDLFGKSLQRARHQIRDATAQLFLEQERWTQ